jgi:hypothetical protein
METVKINRVEMKSGRTGKRYYNVILDDGRKATTFENGVSDMTGFTVHADLIQNGSFTNIKLYDVVSRPNASENAMAGSSSSSEAKSGVGSGIDFSKNPIFPFLGACNMAGGFLLVCINEGNNLDQSLEMVKKSFPSIQSTVNELYKNHMSLTDTVELAEKIME